MKIPDDIPQDVWDYAAAAERIWNGLRVDRSRIEGHARRRLAERSETERRWTNCYGSGDRGRVSQPIPDKRG